MKIAAYTSCAVNYYAKARVLLESIQKNSPGTTLNLILGDILPTGLYPRSEGFNDVWDASDLGYDRGWIFKHNIMELCTAVKGRALEKLMSECPDADLYVYLDPDVYVYDNLEHVFLEMGDSSIGLVPHILWPEETAVGVRLTEMSVLRHGVYNLGHLFVRGDKVGKEFAAWWRARLDEHCFDDPAVGLFTDQRWIDLVPAIFENVHVLREPIYDVASWNLFGRNITHIQDEKDKSKKRYFVNGRPLITYHFSGSGPTGTHARVRQIFAPSNGSAAELERDYERAIHAHGQKWFERFPSRYEAFPDGTPIRSEARKVYRRHQELQEAFPDPYQDGFLHWLRENRPTLGGGLAISERRAEAAFDDIFDEKWYLETYPTVVEEIEQGRWSNALDHYVGMGSMLLYDPSPFFISSYYYEIAMHLDVNKLYRRRRDKYSSLLWHYLTIGLANGIEPVDGFDSVWYLDNYPDVHNAFKMGSFSVPLTHFVSHGDREWRKPGPSFDPATFMNAEPRAQALLNDDKVSGPFGAYVRLGLVAGRVSV